MKITVLILSIIIALLRLFVPHIAPSLPGTYTAFAHIFIGFLLFGWVYPPFGYARTTFWLPLVLLTALETTAFLLTK
jgi:uncharacterized protein YqgC (DUF456 family)